VQKVAGRGQHRRILGQRRGVRGRDRHDVGHQVDHAIRELHPLDVGDRIAAFAAGGDGPARTARLGGPRIGGADCIGRDIGACPAVDRVLSGAACHDVAPGAAEQPVAAGAAQQGVGPVPALEQVVALSAIHQVVPAETEELVVALEAGDGVGLLRAAQHVPASAAVQNRHDARLPLGARCVYNPSHGTADLHQAHSRCQNRDVVFGQPVPHLSVATRPQPAVGLMPPC
jgi:hypothetical protein